MATQTVEFLAVYGQSLTARLYAVGGSTVIQTASAVTEISGKPGIYLATFTDVSAAEYEIWGYATVGAVAVPVARAYTTLTLTTATFPSYDGAVRSVQDRTGYSLVTAPPTAIENRDAILNAMPTNGWTSGSFGDRLLVSNNSNRTIGVTGSGSGHVHADVHTMQTNTITDSALAASAVTEIQSGLATSEGQTTAQASLDDIQSRLPAALVAGRMDASVGAMQADTVTSAALAASAVTEIQTGLATSAAQTTAQSELDDIQSRLPAALVAGRMDASVGAMQADTVTSAALAASAVTEIQTGLATSAAQTTAQSDLADIQSRLPAALVAGRMDASVGAMQADTVTSAALAASAVTEIQSGLATSAAQTTAQSDLNDIQSRLPAALVSGRMDASVGAMQADTVTSAALAASAVTEIQAGLSTLTDVQVKAQIIEALSVDILAEISTIPGASSTLTDRIGLLFALARNKLTQTSALQTVFADNGSTTIGTATVADNGTTFTRNKLS